MALQVQSLSQPYQATQQYLVTGTVGDTVTAALDDISVATVTPISAKLVAAGITFTVSRLTSNGGAATLTFKDTTDGEVISVTVNLAGDPVAVTQLNQQSQSGLPTPPQSGPASISGQVGQVYTLHVSELNDPDPFTITVADNTVASISITSNAIGDALVQVTLLKSGSTTINVDDGHFGTLSVPVLVGGAAPIKNVTISAIEAVVGGVLVSMPQTVVQLQDSTTGYNLSGGYTISLTQNETYVVTYGIAPAESTTQINVASVVLTPNGTVYIADKRTVQVTAVAVNSTLSFLPHSDGSYLNDGVVTLRSLGQDVLNRLSNVDTGPTEPTNPREGEIFYNTTTNVLEIFEGGSWIPISLGGFEGVLASLSDVKLTSPSNGQVLTYNGTDAKWENQTPPADVSSLNTLTGALSIAGGLGINVTASGSTITIAQKGSTSVARSTVAASTSAVSLLATNANRVGATIVNDQGASGTANLFVACGSAGSTTDYTYELAPGQSCTIPYMYTGSIYGIWDTATGNARITEFT